MGFEILGQVGSVSLLVQSSVFLRKIPLIYVASIYCTFTQPLSARSSILTCCLTLIYAHWVPIFAHATRAGSLIGVRAPMRWRLNYPAFFWASFISHQVLEQCLFIRLYSASQPPA